MSDTPKIGRPPTPNPKAIKLTVRITPKDYEILLDYCRNSKVGVADAVRRAIRGLANQK